MINIKKLKDEQLKLAKKIILTDSFEKIETIAGVDYIYTETDIICSIVMIERKTLKVIEKKYSIEKQNIPYIPGFLSYRIATITLNTFEKLKNKPDLAVISANGIMHPRKIGAASNIGLFLDIPTIGVSKKKLCGEEKDDTIYMDKDVVGKKVVSKELAKPVYVSQGHKIGMKTMMEMIKEMLKGHKLPEPLYLAHKYGNKVKSRIKEKNGDDNEQDEETT
ncbi:MAG: endonuclease V [Candidatus Woesearchaeota archaeon]